MSFPRQRSDVLFTYSFMSLSPLCRYVDRAMGNAYCLSNPPWSTRSSLPYLLAEQLPDSFHDAVLLGIVRVVLGGNLEQAGESLVVLVDSGSYALGDLGIVSVEIVYAMPAGIT